MQGTVNLDLSHTICQNSLKSIYSSHLLHQKHITTKNAFFLGSHKVITVPTQQKNLMRQGQSNHLSVQSTKMSYALVFSKFCYDECKINY